MPDMSGFRSSRVYSQQLDDRNSAIERWFQRRFTWFKSTLSARPTRLKRFVKLVDQYADNQPEDIENLLTELRHQATVEGLSDDYLAAVFALVRRYSERLLGLRHFDVQLVGGWTMINGMIAEMETGQGKSLTATLAAGAAGIAGIPVHVITVNEYLAARDAEELAPLYNALGLSVSVVLNEMDEGAKRTAYKSDIVYCTNKQVAFDYLRDRIQAGDKYSDQQLRMDEVYNNRPVTKRLLLRGLHFAIVDEADSVLIDEAVTPLLISAESTNQSKRHAYEKALRLAEQFEPEEDFILHENVGLIEFKEDGLDKLKEEGEKLGGLFNSTVIREELVAQAIRATRFFKRDHQYLVAEGKVQIIDEFTGRIMPDRNWEGGLHQMIELKEGCEMTGDKETIARISYQRFFRRYLRLSGMTGTGSEVRKELLNVYNLYVKKIPPAQTIRRQISRDHVSLSQDQKWDAVIESIRVVHNTGRPILVGTRSVENSEHLSRLLEAESLVHEVLNARQDKQEAGLIASAGKRNSILVATNMAGRGTDIKLDDDVRELGGLHVIMTERHDSHRIDRQLFGRCGRQGDPGTVQTFVALDDDLVRINMSEFLMRIFSRLNNPNSATGKFLARSLVVLAQKVVERRQYVMRVNVLKADEQFESLLAFSGRME